MTQLAGGSEPELRYSAIGGRCRESISKQMQERKRRFEQFSTGRDDVGRRLDRVARKFLAGEPLGTVFGAIRRGDIRVNGRKVAGAYRIHEGDSVELRTGLLPETRIPPVPVSPAWFEGTIVLENSNVLAVDKPAGLLTHGPGSLQELVTAYLAPKMAESLSFRPGPLHRLDRNTSGLVLFGKSTAGASRFTSLLRSHSVRKHYLALLEGALRDTMTWSDRLRRDEGSRRSNASREGRQVQCIVAPLCSSTRLTLVSVVMSSGFTHQIRAQAALHDHPLAGDIKYGSVRRGDSIILHAAGIALPYFDTVLGFRSLDAPLPPAVRGRLDGLFGASEVASALQDGG